MICVRALVIWLLAILFITCPVHGAATLNEESELEPDTKAAAPAEGVGIRFFHDVEYGNPAGRPLHVEIAMPADKSAPPRPAILFFHPGGFYEGTHKQSPIAIFAKHGYFAASVEYRLTDEAKFPAQLQDGQLSVRWLRANAAKYNVDPTRIVAWGVSAGANLSQMLGTMRESDGFQKGGGYLDQDQSVQAVISFFGGSDYTLAYRIGKPPKKSMDHLLGCTYQQNPERYRKCSPITYVRSDDPPFFVLNGAIDHVVLPEQGMQMNKALAKASVPHEFILVKHAGHMFRQRPNSPPSVPTRDQALNLAFAFLDRYLGQTADRVASHSPVDTATSAEITANQSASAKGAQVAVDSSAEDQSAAAATSRGAEMKRGFDLVKIPSGNLTIYGALWKPQGSGPFPAVIYNHGSEKRVALFAAQQGGYGNLGPFYVSQGFAFLIPLRRGHEFGLNKKAIALSEGQYFNDRVDAESQANPYQHNKIWLHEQDVDNEDVRAAVAWLKTQPYVNANKLIMSGISFGGIQTTLASEVGLEVKAFIPFAPGAMSWNGIPELHDRLTRAMEHAKAPIFLIQAKNDYNLGPSEVLGRVLDKKGPPNQHKLYPDFYPELGHKSGHGGFATWPDGIAIWSTDVMPFIKQALTVVGRKGSEHRPHG